jgi:hypothetical protein
MLSDLLSLIHASASDLIGICFAVVLFTPVVLASLVDLNAEELNRTDEVEEL